MRLAGADVGATNAHVQVIEDGGTVLATSRLVADFGDGPALLRKTLGNVATGFRGVGGRTLYYAAFVARSR